MGQPGDDTGVIDLENDEGLTDGSSAMFLIGVLTAYMQAKSGNQVPFEPRTSEALPAASVKASSDTPSARL